MIEKYTIRLLRECDAGIKMGISSIDDVMDRVKDSHFADLLAKCKKDHEKLEQDIRHSLDRFGDDGKEPNPIAKGMSWMKTTVKLGLEESDATVAELLTDGCSMGVKSLSKYLNQYKAADEDSKALTRKLISIEEQLAADIRQFL